MDKGTTIEPSHANAPTAALKTATQQPGTDGYFDFSQSTKDNLFNGGLIIITAIVIYFVYTRYIRA